MVRQCGLIRRCKARFGLRGVRAGEVSQPGPRRLRLLLGSQSERSPVRATIPTSSGQIRGVQGDVLSTVPASSGTVAAAVSPDHVRVDSDSESEFRERIPDLSSDTMSVPPVNGGESDTDTIDGASEVDVSVDVVAPSVAEEPVVVEPRSS